MTFQRCAIVVGILFCYSFSSIEAVNCERLVFHPDCRGSQTKRSSIQTDETNYISAQTLEDLFGMPAEESRKSSHPSRSRNNVNKNYEKSRLWTALLDRGLNPEAMYDWYLARVQEKNTDTQNRQNWMQDNYPGKNIADGDY